MITVQWIFQTLIPTITVKMGSGTQEVYKNEIVYTEKDLQNVKKVYLESAEKIGHAAVKRNIKYTSWKIVRGPLFFDTGTLKMEAGNEDVDNGDTTCREIHLDLPTIMKECFENHVKIGHTSETHYSDVYNNYDEPENNSPKNITERDLVHSRTPTFTSSSRSGSQNRRFNGRRLAQSEQQCYSCSICNSSFSRKSNLQRHMLIHSRIKPFSCSDCTSSFSQKSQLQNHILTHTKIIPFPFNEKQLNSISPTYISSNCSSSKDPHVNKHQLAQVEDKPFHCPTCNASFSQNKYLKNHLLTHSGVKPFSCSDCDYSSSLKGNLQRHMRTHSGLKPFSCSYCNASFSHNVDLKGHTLTHTGEKPFSCSRCSTPFSRKSYLRRHMKTHTGIKSFSCSDCNSSFSQKSHLQSHILTHSREKPFSCSNCGSLFSLKASLRRHLLTHSRPKPV